MLSPEAKGAPRALFASSFSNRHKIDLNHKKNNAQTELGLGGVAGCSDGKRVKKAIFCPEPEKVAHVFARIAFSGWCLGLHIAYIRLT